MRDVAVYLAVIVASWLAFVPTHRAMQEIGLSGDAALVGTVVVILVAILGISYLEVRLRAWRRHR